MWTASAAPLYPPPLQRSLWDTNIRSKHDLLNLFHCTGRHQSIINWNKHWCGECRQQSLEGWGRLSLCCHVFGAACLRIKYRCLAWMEDSCFVSDTNIIFRQQNAALYSGLYGENNAAIPLTLIFSWAICFSLSLSPSISLSLSFCVCGFHTLMQLTRANSCPSDRSWDIHSTFSINVL